MGLIKRAGDFVYAVRFLKLLTTSWKDMKAYDLGLIDDKGKKLRAPVTSEERDSYTVFHRLVFNIKRILSKAPGGSSKLGSYAAALFLIKENTYLSDKSIKSVFDKCGFVIEQEIYESNWFIESNGKLKAGSYILKDDVPIISTGDPLAKSGNSINIKEDIKPSGFIFGVPVFKGVHNLSKKEIFFIEDNITK